MGLKILHSADWHMGAPVTSFEGEQRDFLRREQMKVPGKISDLCRRENCDLVLLAGDIFDGTPSREVIGQVKRGLEACGVPVFVSPGNHDFCGPGAAWVEEAWPENVTVFTGGLESVLVPGLNCRIYGAGYQSMDCGALLEGFRAEPDAKYHIGVLHGDPVTSQSSYCAITASQVRDSGLQYLGLGHIHKAGQFAEGTTLCAWPGCPMGRGWDETGEKGVILAELDGEARVQFLPLDVPRFYDVELDVSGGLEEALRAALPAAGTEDFYRITLTGETTGLALPEEIPGCPNLFFRDRTVPEVDVWEDMGSDTFRGTYFRLLHQQAGTDPRAALAAEISKRILLGREVRLP